MCDSCREVARFPTIHKDRLGRPVFVKVYSAARAETEEWPQELEELPKKREED